MYAKRVRFHHSGFIFVSLWTLRALIGLVWFPGPSWSIGTALGSHRIHGVLSYPQKWVRSAQEAHYLSPRHVSAHSTLLLFSTLT